MRQTGLRLDSRALRRACLVGALGIHGAPLASDAQAPAVALDSVVITGSHIRQVDAEGALPVQVITREQIAGSGVATVEQLLERVPANVNALNAARTVGEIQRPGLSSANLRGLGGGSTLVLLNGRRLANYAFDGESVDLNSIPLAAIDRVEVLKDGASAIYGTDAIAGVINFILRKDFKGAAFAANVAATQHGGGNQGQLDVSIGSGDLARDGYNVFASLAYQKQQSLPAVDRGFANTAYRPELGLDALHGATFPANIVDRPGLRILNPDAAGGCTPPSSLPTRVYPFRTPACGYDFAVDTDLLPEVDRTSAMLRGTWLAGPQVELFAEALLSWNRFETQGAPMPVLPVGGAYGPPLYPVDGPYYPSTFAGVNGLSGNLVVAYRATELGPRFNTTTNDAQRYVVGAEGRLAGWDFNVAAVHSVNHQELWYGGSWLYVSKFIPALRTGLINPWGSSAPEGRALLASTAFSGTPQSARATTSLLNAFASREISVLPSGPLAVAFGAEARRERLSYDWDPAVLLNGFSPIDNVQQSKSGSRSVIALFAELNVPIVRGLDAQLAARFDDYSDFGSTTNPKVALRWQPLSDLLLRASWGNGFRAPPLYALDAPRGTTRLVAGVPDPVRCRVTHALEDCFIVIQAYAGGNPNLQPETSSQWHAGAVWQARGLSLGIDYWSIEQEGIIVPLDAENALEFHGRFSDRIIRGPVDPLYPALPGPIVGLDLSPINLGSTRTSGIDVALDWLAAPQDWGQVRASVQGTYVLKYDTQIDGVQYVSTLGSAVYGAPVPRWRSTLTIGWSRAAWGATLAQVFSGGYTDQQPGADGAPRKVGAASSWDLQMRYAGLPGWQLAAGIQNLFDEKPPASNQIRATQVGYDPQMMNPLGRTFYLRAVWTVS